MSIVLLLLVLIVSLAFVRLAAIGLELTGIPWDRAKFHALSAFTNTGFPNREAEEAVNHPVRRRIISYLVILGNAGLITTVASLASSLVETSLLFALRNLALIGVGVVSIVWFAHRPMIAKPLRAWSQAWLTRRYSFSEPTGASLVGSHGALWHVEPTPNALAIGCSVASLRDADPRIEVTLIERSGETLLHPDPQVEIHTDDRLVVFAQEEAVRSVFGSECPRKVLLRLPSSVPKDVTI